MSIDKPENSIKDFESILICNISFDLSIDSLST